MRASSIVDEGERTKIESEIGRVDFVSACVGGKGGPDSSHVYHADSKMDREKGQ